MNINWQYSVVIGSFDHNSVPLQDFETLPEARAFVKSYTGEGKNHLCIIAKNIDAPFYNQPPAIEQPLAIIGETTL